MKDNRKTMREARRLILYPALFLIVAILVICLVTHSNAWGQLGSKTYTAKRVKLTNNVDSLPIIMGTDTVGYIYNDANDNLYISSGGDTSIIYNHLLYLGQQDSSAGDVYVIFDNGDDSAGIRFNATDGDMEYSNDLSSWSNLGSGGSGGDAPIPVTEDGEPVEDSLLVLDLGDGFDVTLTNGTTYVTLESHLEVNVDNADSLGGWGYVADKTLKGLDTLLPLAFYKYEIEADSALMTKDYIDNLTTDWTGIEDSIAPFALALDGSNSPTASIDWDGQDLINVDSLTLTKLYMAGDKITDFNSAGDDGLNVVAGVLTVVADGDNIVDQSLTKDDIDTNTYFALDGLYLNYASGDEIIYFHETVPNGKSLRWDNTDKRFEFSDSLWVQSGISVNGGIISPHIETDTICVNSDEITDLTGSGLIMSGSELAVSAAGGNIQNQAVKGDDIDSTSENFVFDDAYHVTSADADSAYVTANTVGDTADVVRSEVAAAYLPLAGGEMSGNITMSGAETVDGKDVSTLTDLGSSIEGDELGTGLKDSITNGNTAYGWGDHSSQNYLDNDDANIDTNHYRIAYDSSQHDFLRSDEEASDVDTSGTKIAAALADRLSEDDTAVFADTALYVETSVFENGTILGGLDVWGTVGITNFRNDLDLSNIHCDRPTTDDIIYLPYRVPDSVCPPVEFYEQQDASIFTHASVLYIPGGWPRTGDSVRVFYDSMGNWYTDGDTTKFWFDTDCSGDCDDSTERVERFFDSTECLGGAGNCDSAGWLHAEPHKYWLAGTPYGLFDCGHSEEDPNIFAGDSPTVFSQIVGPDSADSIINPIYKRADFELDTVWYELRIIWDSTASSYDTMWMFYDTGYGGRNQSLDSTVLDWPSTNDTTFWLATDSVFYDVLPDLFMSDPDIFFGLDGDLWIAMRVSYQDLLDGPTLDQQMQGNLIFVAHSSNGINWQADITKALPANMGGNVSPSVVLDTGGVYKMFVNYDYDDDVSFNSDSIMWFYATRPDTIFQYGGAVTLVNLSEYGADVYPYHIEIIPRGMDEMLLLAYTTGNDLDEIIIGKSSDHGESFYFEDDPTILKEPGGDGDIDSGYYRPSAYWIDAGTETRMGLYLPILPSSTSDSSNYMRLTYKEVSFTKLTDDKRKNRYVPLYSIHGNNTTPGDSVILSLESRDAGAIEGYLFCDSSYGTNQTDTVLACGLIPWDIGQADSLIIDYNTSGGTGTTDITSLRLSINGSSQWVSTTNRFTSDTRDTLQLSLSEDTDFNSGGHACLEIIFYGDADEWLKVYSIYLVCDE